VNFLELVWLSALLFNLPAKDTLTGHILDDEVALVAVPENLVGDFLILITGIHIDITAMGELGVVGILDDLAVEIVGGDVISRCKPGIPHESDMGLGIGLTLKENDLFKKLGDVLVLCKHMLSF
jgi:hypothetical protein